MSEKRIIRIDRSEAGPKRRPPQNTAENREPDAAADRDPDLQTEQRDGTEYSTNCENPGHPAEPHPYNDNCYHYPSDSTGAEQKYGPR